MLGTGSKLAAVVLIGLMAIGSIVLWLVVPLAWIFLASRMVESQQPSMGPYVMVLVGIPVTMVLVGKLLNELNSLYGRVTHTTPTVRVRMAWLRSMRDDRSPPQPRRVLDVVMVISVALALTLFGIWFFLFAGSSLPRP